MTARVMAEACVSADMGALLPRVLDLLLPQTSDLLTAYNGALVRMGLYLLIFWPTVGYYVYQDSKQRDYSSPRLRAVALGALGILGLLIHLGLRHSS
jgi:hypothetical protein